MRIFYASDKSPNASLQSQLWRNNLLVPLRELGHDVVEFDYDLGATFRNLDPALPAMRRFIETNRPRVSEALWQQLQAAHAEQPVQLFFSYFYDACITPDIIDRIRELGIVTVNFYCNGSYQLHLVEEISPHYDWCLVPEKFRLKDYRALGAHPLYCQMAANPGIYKPSAVAREFDVTFVGQAYGDRPAHLKHLLDEGIDVRVWGYGWRDRARPAPKIAGLRRLARIARKLLTQEGWAALAARLGGESRAGNGEVANAGTAAVTTSRVILPARIMGDPLSDDEMIRMYSRSKINLGFSSCGETHSSDARILQVRLRDFEVPMSGGFYMVEYMEELEEFYQVGSEIVCYQGAQDLAEKIKYYLGHEDEREKIRLAGYNRCLRDHTWHNRFRQAFAEMGIS